ncbi:MAG: hypothetical protein ACXWLH_00785 [Candidatus Saccharimonadales bacterium]
MFEHEPLLAIDDDGNVLASDFKPIPIQPDGTVTWSDIVGKKTDVLDGLVQFADGFMDSESSFELRRSEI